MENTDSNNKIKNQLPMNDIKKEVLIKRYEFYTQEARHQRMMMWETAKWFSVIVVGLLVFSGQLIIRFEDMQIKSFQGAILPTSILFIIFLITLGCVLLIQSFYRTNLIYITMLGKVEDELGYDERNESEKLSFPKDRFITWWGYMENRQKYSTSKDFVNNQITIWGKGIYARLSSFFILFGIFSLLAIFYILRQL